jgi:hypothetical protein
MRERLNRAVSKTVKPKGFGGSNPPLSVDTFMGTWEYFVIVFWRDVRVVDGARLEGVCAERYRGFKSLSLRLASEVACR